MRIADIRIKKHYLLGLMSLIIIPLLSCTPTQETKSSSPSITRQPTDFELMLPWIPGSFLKQYDIWYSNPVDLKALYGISDLNSFDKLMALPEESRKAAFDILSAIPLPRWNTSQNDMFAVVGWDWLMLDRAVFHENPPPRGFVVAEGSFDASTITAALIELGYREEPYADYSYYSLNEDLEIDLTSKIGQMFMAKLNRVALPGERLVTAPATDIMTGILDTLTDNRADMLDDPAVAAIADSLVDPLAAVLIMPDRIIRVNPEQADTVLPFSLPAAENWGYLHEYSLAGISYRDDGLERYWDICLYYPDKAETETDASELVSRLESYYFLSQFADREQLASYPLTDKWTVGKPVIRDYDEGATLTISNRYHSDTSGSSPLFTSIIELRDLLFLVPDPAPYLKQD
jgi:hypothetical protein